jgi:hypothetical protein
MKTLFLALSLTSISALAGVAGKSAWGYDIPLPFQQLPKSQQSYLQNNIPLEAVGAVKIKEAPFRTTATYLGKFNNFYFFGVAEHAILDKTAYEVEFGHLTQKFTIPIEKKAIFSSVEGDFAIVKAQPGLSQDIEQRLAEIKPVKVSFTPLSTLLQKNIFKEFCVVGRASFPAVIGDTQSFPLLWNPESVALWKGAESEANANLDERPEVSKRQGDVLAITLTKVLADGLVMPLRDPDGLKIGSDLASPFLQSRPTWAPHSLGFMYKSFGRMSGGPIFLMAKNSEPLMIASHWTKGISEDLRLILPQIKISPMRTFGKVVMKRNDKNDLVLSLSQTAPFAYGSASSRAGLDLQLALTDHASALDDSERKALQLFFEASLR